MAALKYKDDHNKIEYLGRERGCEDFTNILGYLDHSPLRYALLTHDPPVVFDSLVKQFWATAVVRPNAAGSHDLVATIDGREVVVTESLIRTQLQFDDANGIFDMPINDILEGMRVIGYPTDGTLTFLKNHLSPQWRFLVHTIMHCLSPKSGSWNQFPSSIATALICLSTGRVYNFSRFILEGMIGNLKATKHKFLMYPRFLQMIVALETADRTPRPTFDFTRKMFANMKFKWEGQPIPLTNPMLAIAAAGNDAAGGDDATNVDNAAANEAAGSAAEAHLVPHSPPVSPVREPTPERQPVSERPPFPSPTIPETEWVIPNSVSPVTDWRPWPYVPPDNYLEPEDLDNIISIEDDTTHGGFHVESPVRPDDAPTPTADAAGRAEDPALLTGLSAKLDRVKKLEKTVKQLRETRLVVDASAAEGDVDIQDDIDLDGLSRMASTALGHDQPAVPSEDVEEREEEEVPLRRKRSAYRRARTEFSTPAFEQFQANLSAGVLPHTAVPEPAGPSVAADKGKVPMPDLDIPAKFLVEDAQARKRFEEEQASERLVQRLRAEDLAQEDLPNVSEERAKELDDLMMRMTETDWLNLMMQVGSNPALARELLGADVNEENFIERMNAVKEKKKLSPWQIYGIGATQGVRVTFETPLTGSLVRLSTTFFDQACHYEPHSKRQRVERVSSQPASVPAATTLPADDPDSAGGGSSNPAGSATPMAGSAASNTAGGAFGAPVTDSTVTTTAAMDSFSVVDLHPNVSTDQIPIDVLFESTSGDINEWFENRLCVASFPSSLRRKHLFGVRSDDFLWDKPVEDFFSSESESDDDMENYIPPLPYGEFKDWEIVLLVKPRRRCWFRTLEGCESVVSVTSILTDVEDFWRTQDEWIVSSWKLYLRVYSFNGFENGMTVVYVCGQAGLRQAYECIASAPMLPKTGMVFIFNVPVGMKMDSPRGYGLVHAVSFDAAVLDVASTVSAACIVAASYIVSAGICDAAGSFVLAVSSIFDDLTLDVRFMPDGIKWFLWAADYVPAGHVLISADRYRIC
ncbi:hypothetical protein Tco_0805189 [Tanacetum coccineum]